MILCPVQMIDSRRPELAIAISAKQAGATRITGIALGGLFLVATFLRVRCSQSRWRRAAIVVAGCVTLFVVALVIAVVGGRDI